ncbi:MAG: hypothetical protein KF700_05940 [Hyphomonadaceae bacterium]|nr:hypothetical protein [Hyphomonadaceae bacterium]
MSLISALSCVALVGFVGFATDVGAVYLEARRLQGAADLAALAAMQNPARAREAAAAIVRDNQWPEDTQVSVTHGAYTPDRALAPDRRFSAGAASANAVRVELTSSAPLYFGRLFMPEGRMSIVRRATAAQARLASFQIGSRLLALRGGAANALLSALAGGEVNLSVMDYDSLARADVDLFAFADALRTRLNLEAASYERTLAHSVNAPDALEALADALNGGDARAERAVRRMAQAASGARAIGPLDTLIDLGPYASQDHAPLGGALQVRVSALDLASAVLQLGAADRQVRFQLAAAAPGLLDTNVWLAIGDRPNNSPWIAITDAESVIVRTAQARLYVETNVAASSLIAGVAQVRLPVLVELAAAQAQLAEISCPLSGRGGNVTLSVSPAIGSVTLGEVNTAGLDNFRTALAHTPAPLLRTALLRVDGEARVDVGGEQTSRVRFSASEIERRVVKSVATRDAAQATVSSLLGRTSLTVRALGLGVNAGAVTAPMRQVLTNAAAPLDSLLNGLTDLLGVRLGEADVRVNGVRCGGAALVA